MSISRSSLEYGILVGIKEEDRGKRKRNIFEGGSRGKVPLGRFGQHPRSFDP